MTAQCLTAHSLALVKTGTAYRHWTPACASSLLTSATSMVSSIVYTHECLQDHTWILVLTAQCLTAHSLALVERVLPHLPLWTPACASHPLSLTVTIGMRNLLACTSKCLQEHTPILVQTAQCLAPIFSIAIAEDPQPTCPLPSARSPFGSKTKTLD